MHRKNLLTKLNNYSESKFIAPYERDSLPNFINFVKSNNNCFDRSNLGHITTSVWIINAEKTHALLTHHKKLNIWVQLGGHNDGEIDCKAIALKEAEEESGILGFKFLHEDIFDIDIHPIPMPCAYHYDIRYLLQAPAKASYTVSEESHDLSWVAFDKIASYTAEPSVLRLNEKCMKHFQL
jgi:8-oxo-dGTP pyrophosphatase MutT (NUDIX family)